ncbi:MAG TPA: hypothetical protein VER96_38865 [Polyangiaceae bacterium]|nr:hypothetical protein [Polyangiaceae bacterium]
MSYRERFVCGGALFTLGAIAVLTGCSAGSDEGTASIARKSGDPLVSGGVAPQINSAPLSAATLGNGKGRITGAVAIGATPDAAAELFRQSRVVALGIDSDDLKPAQLSASAPLKGAATAASNGVGLMYDPATGKPKFRLYRYEQHRDGIPVFRAGLRTLVREDGDHPVVWANADLRSMGNFRVAGGSPSRAVDLDKSLQALRNHGGSSGLPAPSALGKISAPTQTIFAGVDGQESSPRLAMQYTAQAADGAGKWTFVADAETGDILHVESNVHFDVTGFVAGKVITGAESMDCGTVGMAYLPYANLTSAFGNAVTDKSGAYTLKQTGTAPFNIVSNMTGKYFTVDDNGSSDTITLQATPGGQANFLHPNLQTLPENVLAQTNVYKAVNEMRDMLLAAVPQYPVIASQTNFRVNVNVTDTQTCDRTGGAWYDDDNQPRTLNFCPRNTERANTAFRSIIHHEYGHHIVDSAGSGQAAYGEGFADTVAMLFAKDPKIGTGYYLNQCSTPLRNANSTCKYDATQCSSCGGGYYDCGSVLSGTVWDIWKQLDITSPATSGDLIRQLVFSSVLLHSGTAIDSQIAVDMLTLDDNDGLLENGTPHYKEICAGFTAHGMTCPAIQSGLVVKGVDLNSEGLSAGPFAPASTTYTLYNLGPQQSIAFSVAIPTGTRWLTTNKTSGTIALGQSTTVTLTVDQTQAAALGDGRYTAAVQFANTTSGVGTVSRDEKLRVGAPVPIYTANFNDGLQGFTPDGQDENLWHRSTACADSLAGHSTPGSLYYGKDSVCNYTTPIPVFHAINSPEITIANPQTAELAFKYILKTENSSSADAASMWISVNGAAFKIVASNNQVADQKLKETNAWTDIRFDISKYLPASGSTKIKLQFSFNAGDIYANSTTGFAVDDVIVYAQTGTTGQRPCAGYCTNPTTFSVSGSSSYQANNLGTAATCHETTSVLHGGNCGNFVSPRKLYVNGVAMTCNWANWASLPAAKNGGYCVYTTSGNNSWAGFTVW